ncbi:hypothetical protein BTO06_09250 [Tenacibaculum sp. SZ-18]|uniref:STAS-like domain-containing protein n=1 Tax=Tenacibaculum sp. SZ-18 TaxID=754423 RepID=UPI000C2D0DAF|nr:DUF4325 domain-containing protein [Tenacibaculum sp. SZ-18]AUC15315.1 hypothetical protein BTO06_09250 [Tenacibaculum sp. SZ-18]
MIQIELNKKYGPVISDEESKLIYDELINLIDNNKTVKLNFKDIITMSTKSAKRIFGEIYFKMKPEDFYNRIIIENASSILQEIIYDSIINYSEGENK